MIQLRVNLISLKSEGYGEQISKYIEIDFVEVTSKKARVIRKHPELESPLGPELRIGW